MNFGYALNSETLCCDMIVPAGDRRAVYIANLTNPNGTITRRCVIIYKNAKWTITFYDGGNKHIALIKYNHDQILYRVYIIDNTVRMRVTTISD